MSSEGAIKRKLTVYFMDGHKEEYINEDGYTWCPGENSITVSDKYTGEFKYIYPYHILSGIKQETIR